MAYKVKTGTFEGPFDLLLYLVGRKKVDIGSISITEIADQYLEEVNKMGNLDLDVASDFLLVAATLLEIKAQSLVARPGVELDEELAELEPSEARDILIARLIEYKKYKNAAGALNARFENEARQHARPFGPTPNFLDLVPDYLQGVSVHALAQVAVGVLSKKPVELLESEHIASKPIPVEVYVRSIRRQIQTAGRLNFSDLVAGNSTPEIVVVTFLALLELYKRKMVNLNQAELFGDIEIEHVLGSENRDLEEGGALDSSLD
jgi:segregation and condensation protein A